VGPAPAGRPRDTRANANVEIVAETGES